MVQFFAKAFIKDYENTSSPVVRQAYGVLCGSVGIALNILLFLGKFFAGTVSHSISITADAFNNLSDAGSSFITLIGFKMAGQKPDPNHPFGHGRIEYLSGLVISGAILLMAYELLKTSVEKVLHPEETLFSPLVLGILLISILVKLYMASYNRSISKKIDSAAMMATATDSLSDTLATGVVFFATLINYFFDLQIDGYCGILVGLFILLAGINAARDTINPLLGQPPEQEFVEKIEKIVMGYDGVLGIHDLIVHDYGPGRVMISLHAEVSASGNILEIHDMIDTIEIDLKQQLNCEAVIHMDPIVTDDADVTKWKQQLLRILQELDSTLQMHDFRMVKGNTHTNLIFDVVVPYDCKLEGEKIQALIQDKVREINPCFYTVVQIDRSFT